MSRLAPRKLAVVALVAGLCLPAATSSAEDHAPAGPLKLHFEIPHTLPLKKAMHRVELLTAFWAQKYGVRTLWSGPSAELKGRVLGIRLDAKLEVKEGSVGGDVNDPGFFLRGTAASYLHRKFATYLDPKNDW